MPKKPWTKETFFKEVGALPKDELMVVAVDTFELPEDLIKGLAKGSLLGTMWDKWEEDQKEQIPEQKVSNTKLVLLSDIRVDGGTQVRTKVDSSTVKEYAEEMEHSKFPPVLLFFDGATYWMADGFHRYFAARTLKRESISAEVREGIDRDALLYAIGANAGHGLRRTNADKRRAVGFLLRDEEWGCKWNDSELARRANVSGTLVANVRKELEDEIKAASLTGETPPEPVVGKEVLVTRKGKTYPMNVNGMAKSKEDDGDETDVLEELGSMVGDLIDEVDGLLAIKDPDWLDENGFVPEDLGKKIVQLIVVCEEFHSVYYRRKEI